MGIIVGLTIQICRPANDELVFLRIFVLYLVLALVIGLSFDKFLALISVCSLAMFMTSNAVISKALDYVQLGSLKHPMKPGGDMDNCPAYITISDTLNENEMISCDSAKERNTRGTQSYTN